MAFGFACFVYLFLYVFIYLFLYIFMYFLYVCIYLYKNALVTKSKNGLFDSKTLS